MKNDRDLHPAGALHASFRFIKISTDSVRPLHGIPILVKDNIVTNDPLEASSGSLALLGAKPAVESSLITRLRDAGALILGKSNPGEWGNFRGWSIPSGWSPRGGQTTSAYYPHGDPEGSSSGSAVAVSLGLCMAALGTEVCILKFFILMQR